MKELKAIVLILACIGFTSCKKTAQTTDTGKEDSSESKVEAVTEPAEYEHGYRVKVGDQAPDFTIQYLDGSRKQLSDLKGKLVMVQFTASWCGVCRKEMPYIEKEIWGKHKDNPNFALIGVDLKEDKETTAKFARDIKVTYPLTLDTDGSVFGLYTVPNAGVTRNIIIDKEGKIVMLTRLFEMEEFNSMVKYIDEYLAGNF